MGEGAVLGASPHAFAQQLDDVLVRTGHLAHPLSLQSALYIVSQDTNCVY